MSPVAPPAVPHTPEPRWPGRFRRTRGFWQRVSEGQDIDVLWAQFTADARASYGFYGKDVTGRTVEALPHWRRPFHHRQAILLGADDEIVASAARAAADALTAAHFVQVCSFSLR